MNLLMGKSHGSRGNKTDQITVRETVLGIVLFISATREKCPRPFTTSWYRPDCLLSAVLCRQTLLQLCLADPFSSLRLQLPLITLSKVVLPSAPGRSLPTSEISFPAVPMSPTALSEPPAVSAVDQTMPCPVIFCVCVLSLPDVPFYLLQSLPDLLLPAFKFQLKHHLL